MKRIHYYLFSLWLLLSGCATVSIAGASGAIAYTFTNVAYKTFVFPLDHVESATHKALARMGIKEVERKETETGMKILGETSELKIHIDLESITSKTTKMSVDAVKSIVVKDVSTATAIIEQTGTILATGE